jgi:hypothetical protein
MKGMLVSALLDLMLAAGACACANAHAEPPRAPDPVAPAIAPPPQADAPAASGQPMAKDLGKQTLEGELVDLSCYLDHGARGEHHKACGTSCALKGLPIALLDKDNKITIVVGVHDRPMNNELADKMGTTVRLTGKVVSRDGMQMIEVSNVEAR